MKTKNLFVLICTLMTILIGCQSSSESLTDLSIAYERAFEAENTAEMKKLARAMVNEVSKRDRKGKPINIYHVVLAVKVGKDHEGTYLPAMKRIMDRELANDTTETPYHSSGMFEPTNHGNFLSEFATDKETRDIELFAEVLLSLRSFTHKYDSTFEGMREIYTWTEFNSGFKEIAQTAHELEAVKIISIARDETASYLMKNAKTIEQVQHVLLEVKNPVVTKGVLYDRLFDLVKQSYEHWNSIAWWVSGNKDKHSAGELPYLEEIQAQIEDSLLKYATLPTEYADMLRNRQTLTPDDHKWIILERAKRCEGDFWQWYTVADEIRMDKLDKLYFIAMAKAEKHTNTFEEIQKLYQCATNGSPTQARLAARLEKLAHES